MTGARSCKATAFDVSFGAAPGTENPDTCARRTASGTPPIFATTTWDSASHGQLRIECPREPRARAFCRASPDSLSVQRDRTRSRPLACLGVFDFAQMGGRIGVAREKSNGFV